MALYIGNKKYCAIQKANINNQDILITENGTYTCEETYTGFGVVRVKVPTAIIDDITITATTEQQVLEPLHDGFGTITVNPVTADIDADILSGNIKKGINILGVDGELEFITEELVINPSIESQTKTPTKDGFSKVLVNAVTADIDDNITPGNILKGIEILGVTGTCTQANETTRNITKNGTYEPEQPYTGFSQVVVDVKLTEQPLDITPTTQLQTFTSPDEFTAYTPITVQPVTNDIDANIVAGNIKKGVEILGVVGTCNEIYAQEITVTENGTYTPTGDYNAFSSVIVNVDTVNNEDISITQNGTYTPSEGHTGFGTVTVDINTVNNIDLTVDNNGEFTPNAPYTGFGKVTVDVSSRLTETTINPSIEQQVITPASNKLGFNKITVNGVDASIDENITAENIKYGVTILGVTGVAKSGILQEKTITDVGTFEPDAGFDGFSSVTVDMAWIEEALQALNAGDLTSTQIELQQKTVTQAGTYGPDSGYDGISQVTVDLSWVDAEIQRLSQQYTTTEADSFMSDSTTQINSNATLIRQYACYYMMDLTEVNLNNALSIGQYAFANTRLQTITINTSSVCQLDSINAFSSTPLETIYVPDNLVDSYKTETNWVTYADKIKPVSEKDTTSQS